MRSGYRRSAWPPACRWPRWPWPPPTTNSLPCTNGGDYRPEDAPAPIRLRTWPGTPEDEPGLPLRYVPYNGPETLPGWLSGPVPVPRACVTLGSILPKTGGLEVLPPLLAGLQDVFAEVVVVLPDETATALADLGPFPPGVRLASTVTGPWTDLGRAGRGPTP